MPGGKQDSGAKDAAKVQAQATKEAAQLERQNFLDQQRLSLPWLNAGESALWEMMDMLGLPRLQQRVALPSQINTQGGLTPAAAPATTPTIISTPGGNITAPLPTGQTAPVASGTPPLSDALTSTGAWRIRPKAPVNLTLKDFEASPDYQFRLNEGIRSIDRAAAARGMLGSGSRLKALTDYGSNVASAEYGNWYGRKDKQYSDYLNRLAGIAGVGQTETGNLQQLGAQSAARQADYLTQGANARAAGMMAGAGRQSSFSNAIQGGVGGAMAGSQLASLAGFSNPWGAAIGGGLGLISSLFG